MKSVKSLAVLNFVFYLIAFLASMLTQLKLIGGKDIGEVSRKYDSVFAPAGITFSIWGIIYLGLFGFTIYHLVQACRKDPDTEANQAIQKIGFLFIVNNIATTLWVFAWMYQYMAVSVILMLIQLYTLAKISIKIQLFDTHKTLTNKAFTQVPLSFYFAWICIATIANISAFLVSINWDGGPFTPSLWTIILIAIACMLTFFMVRIKANPFFGLVVIWAFYGIQLKRAGINPLLYENVITSAWFGIGFITIMVLMQFIANWRKS